MPGTCVKERKNAYCVRFSVYLRILVALAEFVCSVFSFFNAPSVDLI